VSESPIETPELVTVFVWCSVLLGLFLAVFQLNLFRAGLMATIAGVLAAAGLQASAARTTPGHVTASCLLALSGTALAATVALGLLATYESFSILTVPISLLLARTIPFVLLAVAVGIAIAGATALPYGPTLVRGATPATTNVAVVVVVQTLLSVVLLWDLFVENLDALGYTPGQFLAWVLIGIGTNRPAVGPFLFLFACTSVLAGFTLIRLEPDPPSASGHWLLLIGAVAGGLTAPATVATHLGVLDSLQQLSPFLFGVVALVTTNPLVRLLLLGTILLTSSVLVVRRFDRTSVGTVLRPAVAVVGGVLSPLLLAIIVEVLPVVEYLLDRTPPDAANLLREMLAVSGSVPLLVGASTAATTLLALSISVL
jgi:hypothetical protein